MWKMYDVHRTVNNGTFPSEEQYNIVVELFIRSLQELGIDTVTFLEVADVIDAAKPYILGQKIPETRKKCPAIVSESVRKCPMEHKVPKSF